MDKNYKRMEQPTLLCRYCPSVKSFKDRLDNHWASQELTYDWEAELSGTRSRCRVEFWVFRVLPLHLL